jgi:ATP-dependent Clp protease ATP-binding subunit ClpC
LGYDIQLTEEAKDYIAEKGFDPNFGARPLKRAIQKFLEDPIAEEILKGELVQGDTMEVDFDKEKSEIRIIGKTPKKKKKKEEEKEEKEGGE